MVCAIIGQIFDIVCRGSRAALKSKYLPLWESYIAAYSALMQVDDSKPLEPQAAEVARLARQFGKDYSRILAAKSTCVYYHEFVYHVYALILRFGSLSKWSQQGLEHLHHWHKLIRSRCGKAATAGKDCLLMDFTRLIQHEQMLDASVAAVHARQELETSAPAAESDSESESDEEEDE